jgi:biotin carboxyl carrier protein
MGSLMGGDAKVTEVSPGELLLEHDGRRRRLFVAVDGDTRWVFFEGHVYQIEVAERSAPTRPARRSVGGTTGALSAPMPATVLRIQTSPGAVVKKGETLLVLEAMKMELPLRSPQDGTIETVHCREGELVQPGVSLVEFKES